MLENAVRQSARWKEKSEADLGSGAQTAVVLNPKKGSESPEGKKRKKSVLF